MWTTEWWVKWRWKWNVFSSDENEKLCCPESLFRVDTRLQNSIYMPHPSWEKTRDNIIQRPRHGMSCQEKTPKRLRLIAELRNGEWVPILRKQPGKNSLRCIYLHLLKKTTKKIQATKTSALFFFINRKFSIKSWTHHGRLWRIGCFLYQGAW